MVKPRATPERKITLERVSQCLLVTFPFLKQPHILSTPPFLWENSEPYFSGKISKTQTLPS